VSDDELKQLLRKYPLALRRTRYGERIGGRFCKGQLIRERKAVQQRQMVVAALHRAGHSERGIGRVLGISDTGARQLLARAERENGQ